MPIVDVRTVVSDLHRPPADAAQVLADSIARVLNAKTGRVWVRLSELPKGEYAENGEAVDDSNLPVFVSVLHADWPTEDARVQQARELAVAVAASLGRQVERVHIEYAPPGRGRVAFGGKLVV
jgi:phenylpyruvate tautomerase PptA (4-oxalocrotonate tautomerase family)